ncbi:cysteine peptidase family C39 domain-containing protein [Snodgrassella sp. CFCC 13594]|uniref:cysteine peptidase family C39 domain-containing protein n=1 Tax=Snodgrassella sp. CFCC 13594 TaxID=1775559 RepID=UPI0009EEC107
MICRIIQEDSTGCGLACAAMLGRTTYSRAKSLAIELGIVSNHPPFYTSSRELSLLLSELGLHPSKGRRLSHWESLKCLSVVGINYNDKTDTWHWVVYVPSANGGYVLDPKKSIKSDKREDFNRMVPRSYIPVAV